VLQQLESKHVDENASTPKTHDLSDNIKILSAPKLQLSIFDAHSETFDEIRTMLDNIDINRLTPVEALMKLNEIKQKVK
ncbi:MAG: mutS, partial [Segetibacter sp.]|nr:mutS [Segetibacter sp.]